jgi:beta-mannosidase
VIGGRWKPLHYFLRASGYTDVTVACGSGGVCYVKNDAPTPFQGTVSISAVQFATGSSMSLLSQSVSLAAGAGVSQWLQIDMASVNANNSILIAEIVAAPSGQTVCYNVIALTTPQNMNVLPAKVSVSISNTPNPDSSIDITVSSDVPAMYVTLTTLAAGRFSDNAFFLNKVRTIQFVPFGALDLPTLKASLRVEDLSGNKNN